MRSSLLSLIICLVIPAGLIAQEKEEAEKKAPPRVAMCVPLAVPVGKTTEVLLRGWDLEEVKEITASTPDIAIKILARETAQVPGGQNAMRVGDKQIRLEVTVPDSVAAAETLLTLKSPVGESTPHKLLIGCKHPVVQDKEENDGFRVAQQIEIPQIIDGQIHGDRNVDVFTFEVMASQQLIFDLQAQRLGSELDAILTLYDERGTIITVNDDHADSRDARLEVSLKPGKYFLSLQDANDRGGPAHPYRLMITAEK